MVGALPTTMVKPMKAELTSTTARRPARRHPRLDGEVDQEGALFGIVLGTAGDVNGDGYADVIIGALGYDNGQTDGDFVYFGSPSGLSNTRNWTASR